MKLYKVYANPQGNHEAVKQGWSWPAFFFSFIWAMIKKMWGLGVGVLIALLVFRFIIGFIIGASGAEALTKMVVIMIKIMFGKDGNKWREDNLSTRGYEYKKTVAAANQKRAIALYMKEKMSISGLSYF